MASALLEEPEDCGRRSQKNQKGDTVGTLWVVLTVEQDPQGRGIGTLLVEVGAGDGGGGRGGGGVEQREQWEDLLVTRPESENELSQTNRSVGGVFVGVVPRV